MSTNFGTTSLPTVFKPTGATPIDVRTYFESYASALEAARIAAVAGDSNVIYYFGQLLTVYEPTTGAATIYKIVKAPEGTTYTDSEGNEKTATGALEAIDTTFEVGDIPIATASSAGAVKVAATSDIALAAPSLPVVCSWATTLIRKLPTAHGMTVCITPAMWHGGMKMATTGMWAVPTM